MVTNAAIPQGWRYVQLGDICIEQGERGGAARGLPVLSSTKYSGLVPSDEYFKRPVYSRDLGNYKLVRRDWFAYATNHLSEGSIGLQRDYDAALVSPIYTVFSTTDSVHPPFLVHLLKSDPLLNSYAIRDQATVDRRGAVRYRDFATIQIGLPPLWEQRRIANILGATDAAIGQVEVVINKLRKLKVGLTRDLLTLGLDKKGKLRNSTAHPEQFKDSALGKIPCDWDVHLCREVCRENVVGIVIKPTQYYVERGVPALRSANVREDGVDPSDLVFISESSNRALAKSVVRTGDVVTVRTGYCAGMSAVVPREFDGSNCIDIIVSRPERDITGDYLALWINSDFGKGQVLKAQGGLAQQHFNVGDLQGLLVPKPCLSEQKVIADLLSNFALRIRAEIKCLDKLRFQKKGLQRDLLTGRVRV